MSNLIGIGYAGTTTSEFLQELEAASVGLVVDVRAWPQSRTAPFDFNRGRIESTLREHGIDYVWLGETLGNPKDEKGRRTLDGFRRWMRSSNYEQGANELLEIIQRTSAGVALLCVERNEDECHRWMILRDLRRRLAIEGLPPLPAIPAEPDNLREAISLLVRAATRYRTFFYEAAALHAPQLTPHENEEIAMAHILLDKWMNHLEITPDDPDSLFFEPRSPEM